MVTRLSTEDELENLYADQGVDESYLQNIVAGTPTTAPTPTQTPPATAASNPVYDFMSAAGQDPALATQRGIQYARQQGWTPEQTTQQWNQALGTNFTLDDFYRVTGLTPNDPSFAGSNATFSNFGDTGSWDFGAGAVYDPQTNLIKAPGTVFQSGKDAIVSDELFWNPHSVTGPDLQKRIQDAQAQGQRAGVVITPYAVFQGKATNEQLLNEIKNSGTDFVTIDPYYLGFGASSKELLDWARTFVPQVRALGKEVKLVTQGFAPKGQEQQTLEHNQKMLAIPGVSEFINFGLEDAKDLQGDPNWVSIGNDYGKVVAPTSTSTSAAPTFAPTATSIIPGGGIDRTQFSEAAQAGLTQGGLEGVRPSYTNLEALGDDFQTYKVAGESGDSWSGKTTLYDVYDPYGNY